MKSLEKPRMKFISQQDAIELFSKTTQLISEKEAGFLYALSKMTNPTETRDHKKNK